MKHLTVVIALIALSSCMATVDKIAGLGQISVKTESFDGSKVIEVSETFVKKATGNFASDIKLGGRWSSNSPESVILTLKMDSSVSSSNSYTNFESVSVNLDGKITKFDDMLRTQMNSSAYNTVSNTIYTESNGGVIISLDYMQSMINSNDCKIRVFTSDGYHDMVFDVKESSGQRFARERLAEFMSLVIKSK